MTCKGQKVKRFNRFITFINIKNCIKSSNFSFWQTKLCVIKADLVLTHQSYFYTNSSMEARTKENVLNFWMCLISNLQYQTNFTVVKCKHNLQTVSQDQDHLSRTCTLMAGLTNDRATAHIKYHVLAAINHACSPQLWCTATSSGSQQSQANMKMEKDGSWI